MNLIFLIDNGKVIGGGDYAQFKFAEHLAKRGHKVTVFAANYNRFLEDFSKTSNLSIHIKNEIPKLIKGIGKLNKLWGKVYTGFLIEPYLKKNAKDIDFIIGYLRESAIKTVKLGKRYHIKTVNFIFENPEWMKNQLGKRFLNEYKGRFRESWDETKEAYLKTDILIPNSNVTKANCSKWLDRNIEKPVYPGTYLPEINKKVEEKNQIIYVGRLNEYKNVNEIVEALAKIHHAPKLIIVGDGEEEKNLRKLAKKLNVQCEFKGSLSDNQKFEEIQKSMFMVFPSSFEGFGMPPAEALVCGKPCICSDIPVLKEIYGSSVEFFKEHDINSLTQKIELLIKNKTYRKSRGIKGRDYILKKYSWEKSAKNIEMVLTMYKRK